MTEQPKKIVRGAGGVAGGAGGNGTIRDNLISDDVVEFTLGLCEGPIGGLTRGPRSFYLDDTPLVSPTGENNFDPFSVEVFHGEADPTVVRNTLGGISSNVQVGVQMAQNVPIVRTTPSNLRNQIDQIEIRLVFHHLAGYGSSGDQVNYTAQFEIQYRQSGETTWNDIFPDTPTIEIYGKTTSNYPKEYVLNVPRINNDWEIRVNKLQEDSHPNYVIDFSWESIQCTTQEDRAYPDLALVRGIGKASDRFSSIPEFSGIYSLRLINVPSNYDPVTRHYDGVWDGTFKIAHTDNPAWIVYDLIMDPKVGLRAMDPTINADRFSFYDAAKWCDEFVPIPGTSNYQPRWTYNDLITSQRQGIDLIYYICGLFGAVPDSDRNGSVILRLDRPGNLVQVFGPESVENGVFSYQRTDVTERKNDITVKFINPNLGWNEDARRVFDQELIDANGRLNETMTAIGCIDPHEAQRRAYRRLLQANTEQLTVSFTTTRAGISLELFQLIGIADPDMNWGLSGRVKSQSGSTIYLRDTLFVPVATDMTLLIQTPSGPQELTVQSSVANTKELTITAGSWPADAPEVAQFTLSATEIGLVKPFRIIEIKSGTDDDRITITALEQNVNKYGDVDNLTSTPTVNYGYEGSDYPAAPVIDIVESGDAHILVNADGTQVNRLLVRWIKDPNSMSRTFEVAYRVKNEEDYQFIQALGTEIYIPYLIPGKTYEVKVRGISSVGRKGDYSAVTEHLMSGRGTPPQNVPTVTATVSGRNVELDFAALADPEIAEYLVREGADWDTGVPLGSTTENRYVDTNIESPDRTYHVKALTKSGLLSATESSVSVNIAAPGAPAGFNLTSELRSITLIGGLPSSPYFKTFNVYVGGAADSFGAATLIGTFTGTQFSYAPQVGEEKYWITQVDVWNRESSPSVALSGSPGPVEIGELGSTVTNAIDAASQSAAGDVAAAQAAAAAALASQTAAETAETNTAIAQGLAETAQAAAETAQAAAETAEANTIIAQAAAETAETNAGLSATSASTAQSAAEVARDSVLERFHPLAEINTTIASTAVDVFVYDTRLDYDGGAWRKRCRDTSWYNETLNTATRGSRRDFPQVALIVLEATGIKIYDADDPDLPMWMVFEGNYTKMAHLASVTGGAVVALNGSILQGSTQYDLNWIDFIRDAGGNSLTRRKYAGNISQRNDALSFDVTGSADWMGDADIVNRLVTDVAMTVLDGAPTDPDTGLPVPTIAVAVGTPGQPNGGTSIIHNDGTVVDIVANTGAGGYANRHVEFDDEGRLITSQAYGENWLYLHVFDVLPTSDIAATVDPAGARTYKPTFSNPSLRGGLSSEPAVKDITPAGEAISVATDAGLRLLNEDTDDQTRSAVAYITSSYNTGYMVGDIRGAWLSDTDSTNLVGATPVDDDFTGYADQTAAESGGWSFGQDGSGGWTFDAANDKAVADGAQTSDTYLNKPVTTVAGATYRAKIVVSGEACYCGFWDNANTGGSQLVTPASRAPGTHYINFTAIDTTSYFSAVASSGGVDAIEELVVWRVDLDRSVNANPLVVNGTITRSPVASGAELVGYSFGGLGSSIWLKDDNFSISSSDFCIKWWSVDSGSDRSQFMIDDGTKSTNNPATGMYSWTYGAQLKTQLNGGTFHTPVGSIPADQWNMFAIVVSGGVLKAYINGVEVLSGGTSVSNPTDTHLWVGNGYYSGRSEGMALFRISETAPSAEQIAEIYAAERPLFQENVACTLYGSSDAVTALAYDEDTRLLLAGTSAGRSEFSGLRRVSNTTDPVTKAISAVKSLIAEA